MGVNMTINIKDIDINYIQYGKGKDMVLLHGWGQNIEMMDFLGKPLSDNYRITILDLPGFGKTSEPIEAWTIYDYVEMLKGFLEKLKIEKPILVGHSFGGRISIVYASKYKTDRVVLFGSPCIRKEKKQGMKVKILKELKKVPGLKKLEGFAKRHIGSTDYRNASEVMRQTLVYTVNEDLSSYAKKIRVPVLLIWGEKDTEAPIDEARELEKLIDDAALISYPLGTHYAYLEYLNNIVPILVKFSEEK